MRKQLLRTVVLVAMLSAATGTSAAEWNLERDFSVTDNPSGVWTYGYADSAAPGYSLTPYGAHGLLDGVPNLEIWARSLSRPGLDPNVTHNGTESPIVIGDTTWLANSAYFHPGTSTLSVYRWTAPASGEFSLSTSMQHSVGGGDGVDIWVIKNAGSTLFTQYIPQGGSASFATDSLLLTRGDTLDFLVGSHANWGADTTRISAQLSSSVPEPSAVIRWLSLGAVGAVVAWRWRRRKAV